MNKARKTFLILGFGYVIIKWALITGLGAYLYKAGLWNNWFLLISPFLGLALFYFKGRAPSKKPSFRIFFKKAIEKIFPTESGKIMSDLDARYKIIVQDVSFSRSSSNPMDRRLDFSSYFLSLIQILEQHGLPYDEIRRICLDITMDYVAPKNAFQRWMKLVPAKVIGLTLARPLLRILNRKISRKGHPDGFRAEVLMDKSQTLNLGYGVDIHECGICKLFRRHNASKYATILCEVDRVTSELAGLELVRHSTIAYGAAKCDFRWKRKQPIGEDTRGEGGSLAPKSGKNH